MAQRMGDGVRHRGWLVAGLALGVLVVGFLGLRAHRRSRPQEAPPTVESAVGVPMPEAERTQLVLKEGRLHAGDAVFTGLMLEHYPDGGLKSRSAVSNGVLQGVSEGWFTNQVRQIEEHFTNGVAHGERTRWNEQGQKVAAATVVEGRIEGTFRRWHGNGVLSEEMSMKRGVVDGLARSWYPSGFLQAEVWMAGGAAKAQRRYKDGERPGDAPPTVGAGL